MNWENIILKETKRDERVQGTRTKFIYCRQSEDRRKRNIPSSFAWSRSHSIETQRQRLQVNITRGWTECEVKNAKLRRKWNDDDGVKFWRTMCNMLCLTSFIHLVAITMVMTIQNSNICLNYLKLSLWLCRYL